MFIFTQWCKSGLFDPDPDIQNFADPDQQVLFLFYGKVPLIKSQNIKTLRLCPDPDPHGIIDQVNK